MHFSKMHFSARSFNEVGKTGKEERKSKNENTRLRRWGRENLTVLPYLRTYFRGLNAIRKSCFETPHTASCVTRTVLDRLCSDAGSSGTLRRKMLLFVVTRFYCCWGCLSKKRFQHMTCNPTWVLCHEHVNEMFGFLWITHWECRTTVNLPGPGFPPGQGKQQWRNCCDKNANETTSLL